MVAVYAEMGNMMLVELPHSEVCIQMRVAGKRRRVLIVRTLNGLMAQVVGEGNSICHNPVHGLRVYLSESTRKRHEACGDFIGGPAIGSPITMEEAGFHRDKEGWYINQ